MSFAVVGKMDMASCLKLYILFYIQYKDIYIYGIYYGGYIYGWNMAR